MRKSALSPEEIRAMCKGVGIADRDIARTVAKALDYHPATVRCWIRGSRSMTDSTRKKFLTWIEICANEQDCERMLIQDLLRRLA